MSPRFLFITRNYPPKVGGLEAFSYHLIREFESRHSVYKITLSKPIVHLVWFLPFSFLWAVFLIKKKGITHVHLCDGLLAPVGLVLKMVTGTKVTLTIHGLDITYPHSLHQWVIPRSIQRLDRVICDSRASREACLIRDVPEANCTIIPVGVDSSAFTIDLPKNQLRGQIERLFGISFQHKRVLLTVGRLVKRKGHEWFIQQVMPRLSDQYIYVIVGNGPEFSTIENTIRKTGQNHRVFLLGNVSEQDKKAVYYASDIFIMPNITVRGDMEGFGIVALEAGSCGLPIIASNIEGIRDAVIDGKTGYLVEESNAGAFVDRVIHMGLNPNSVQSLVRTTYDWQIIYQQYRDTILKGI